MKYIIFDSGPLINFSMNGVLYVLRKLRKEFSGKFIISPDVKKEIIDRPIKIKRFELGALQLKALFEEKIIELPSLNPKQLKEFEKLRNEIENLANSIFFTEKGKIKLIHKGEASSLALSKLLNGSNLIAIDERTTRMLCENPENLRKLLQKKLHANVKSNKKNYDFFKQFKVIRSTELVYIASKKNLFELKDPKVLEAMLYGMKYKGCSVSEEEIEQMKKL